MNKNDLERKSQLDLDFNPRQQVKIVCDNIPRRPALIFLEEEKIRRKVEEFKRELVQKGY